MGYILECLRKTPPPVLIFAERKNDVDTIHEYLLLKGCLAWPSTEARTWLSGSERSTSLSLSRRTSWWPQTWPAKVWTSRTSNTSSTTTCRRTSRTTFTGLDVLGVGPTLALPLP